MLSKIISLVSPKDYIYIGIIIAMIGSAWYILEDWHYGPLRTQERTILMLGKQLNQCVGSRDMCEAQKKKDSVEDFQDTIGEEQIEDFNFDLDNLTT